MLQLSQGHLEAPWLLGGLVSHSPPRTTEPPAQISIFVRNCGPPSELNLIAIDHRGMILGRIER